MIMRILVLALILHCGGSALRAAIIESTRLKVEVLEGGSVRLLDKATGTA